jgi:predicted metal-dependent phosphoesterase TrpH
MNELVALRERAMKWVIGIEMTSNLPKELLPASTSVHIIGLFVNPTNEALREHCHRAQGARVRRMEGIVGNLQKLGFRITKGDCLEMSEGESVGRPHVVQALEKYQENKVVMESLRREMAKDAENDTEIQKCYARMMEKGERQHPYTLFLSPDAYRNGYVEHDYMPDLDEAVALIRGAGGIAVVAHYGTIRSKMSLGTLDKLLAEKRIDGAEVVYGIREYGTVEEKTLVAERAVLRAIIQKHGALALGGSDAHTHEELKHYVASEWFSGETAGFTEHILATGHVDKKFSSLH